MYRHNAPIAADRRGRFGEEVRRCPDLHHLSEPPRHRGAGDRRRRTFSRSRQVLAAQGRGEAVVEPRVHLEPGVANGHFNVLRGAIRAPVDLAGVKVVGDFVDNYKPACPRSSAPCCSIRATARRRAILDASGITDMRTGAVSAIGAKISPARLEDARPYRRARHRLLERAPLDHLFDFDESASIRAARKPRRFRRALSRDLGKPVVATTDWQSCVEDADIVVEASRLPSRADAANRMDQAGRLRGALRHDERG